MANLQRINRPAIKQPAIRNMDIPASGNESMEDDQLDERQFLPGWTSNPTFESAQAELSQLPSGPSMTTPGPWIPAPRMGGPADEPSINPQVPDDPMAANPFVLDWDAPPGGNPATFDAAWGQLLQTLNERPHINGFFRMDNHEQEWQAQMDDVQMENEMDPFQQTGQPPPQERLMTDPPFGQNPMQPAAQDRQQQEHHVQNVMGLLRRISDPPPGQDPMQPPAPVQDPQQQGYYYIPQYQNQPPAPQPLFTGQLPGPFQRPCPCPDCYLIFPSGSAQRSHATTAHDLARPFVCPLPGCNHRFTLAAQLGHHTDGHNWRISCDICGEYFMSHQGLTHHMLVHDPARER